MLYVLWDSINKHLTSARHHWALSCASKIVLWGRFPIVKFFKLIVVDWFAQAYGVCWDKAFNEELVSFHAHAFFLSSPGPGWGDFYVEARTTFIVHSFQQVMQQLRAEARFEPTVLWLCGPWSLLWSFSTARLLCPVVTLDTCTSLVPLLMILKEWKTSSSDGV